MPAVIPDDNSSHKQSEKPLSFPPPTRDHILNCSYDSWYPRYSKICPSSRIIPLPPIVVEYLREDRIILADDDHTFSGGALMNDKEWRPQKVPEADKTLRGLIEQCGGEVQDDDADDDDDDDDDSSSSSDKDESPPLPPNTRFPDFHRTLRDQIADLGGEVSPKLNWSAPKDATWILPYQNTLKCISPNDIYMLLKSSNFVSFDLEYAFDDCATTTSQPARPLQHVLVLRSYDPPLPSLEFRCFVKHRTLIGICQRDLNYYSFLQGMRSTIINKIEAFFENFLRFSFADGNFVFDVYLPQDMDNANGTGRVRLVDINPWAARTDTLLFGWDELLDFKVSRPTIGAVEGGHEDAAETTTDDEEEQGVEDDGEDDSGPELRLVENDDPAAYNFSGHGYSAHKLPKEFVDATIYDGLWNAV